MADVELGTLPAVSSVDGSEVLPCLKAGVADQMTASQVASAPAARVTVKPAPSGEGQFEFQGDKHNALVVVPTLAPSGPATDQLLAFDLVVKGNPTEVAGIGKVWIDMCNTNAAQVIADVYASLRLSIDAAGIGYINMAQGDGDIGSNRAGHPLVLQRNGGSVCIGTTETGAMNRGLSLANADVPTSSPSAGVFLYALGNQLFCKDGTGTVTRVAPPSPGGGTATSSRVDPTVPAVGDFLSPATGAAVSAYAQPVGTATFIPIYVPMALGVDALGVFINTGTASSVVRVALFADDATTGKPGTVLAQGTVSGATSSSRLSTTFAEQVIQPGWYWLGAVNQTAAATLLLTNSPGYQSASNVVPYTWNESGPFWQASGITGAFASNPTVTRSSAAIWPALRRSS